MIHGGVREKTGVHVAEEKFCVVVVGDCLVAMNVVRVLGRLADDCRGVKTDEARLVLEETGPLVEMVVDGTHDGLDGEQPALGDGGDLGGLRTEPSYAPRTHRSPLASCLVEKAFYVNSRLFRGDVHGLDLCAQTCCREKGIVDRL